MRPPKQLVLGEPEQFLRWLGTRPDHVDLDEIDVAHAWALVAIAALCRVEQDSCPIVSSQGISGAARFAHALGLPGAIGGLPAKPPSEAERTVPIGRFKGHAEIDSRAREIARLLVDEEHEESRPTIQYVLVELFRNVVQHSGDALGGVVAAQRMRAGKGGYLNETVQVAVADTGMGIPRSLSGHHPEAADPAVALERSIWPHFSGAFPKGATGSSDNAGMGLFFISEMTKLTGGRLVIASRGATLTLQGAEDPEKDSPRQDILPVGFPGTLVGFELGLSRFHDHDRLIETVRQRALERTPQRAVKGWLIHDAPPPGTDTMVVAIGAEDTAEAARVATDWLRPRIIQGQAVALDFSNLRTCTQSFAHALLYDAVRLAWATRTRIYVRNASGAVRSTLALVEAYALGG